MPTCTKSSRNRESHRLPGARRISAVPRFRRKQAALGLGLALMLGQAAPVLHAASTDLSDVPMAVSNMVTPNVLVIYDNSQSMDAFMNGTLVSGNDPSTRGNIGRSVMRNAITTYRGAFNWGLMTYGLTGAPGLYNTYAYYLGSNAGMVFTDDCVGFVAGNPPTVGVSASNGNRRCIANPQPFSPGGNFVTYDQTGDDANIQDVLYTTGVYTGLWGLSSGGTSFNVHKTHNPVSGSSWAAGAFGGGLGNWTFTPTDAGYLPTNPPITREIWAPRGWGYNQDITGGGSLTEQVAVDSAGHYANLQSKLGNETNGATGEVKNAAVYTPLRGSLRDAKTYFSSAFAGKTSPVQYSCQQNFVMMVTDGMPTGKTDGSLYSAGDRANTCIWNTSTNSCTSGSFGDAADDAISAARALRTTTVGGYSSTNKDGTGAVTGKYDVQTYVVALGDTVANADAMSVMNAMAFNGGTGQAILATNATAFQNAITHISDDIVAKVGSSSAVAVSNPLVTSSDHADYVSIYNSGTWSGDLNSFALDVTTGAETTTTLWISGSAATQLDSRTSSGRFIVTSTDTPGAIGGLQFQPVTAATATKLSAAQQTLLNTPPAGTDGAAVLDYLRGDRSGEPATYRPRAHLLGDIVDSEAVMVGPPSANYADAGFSAFKSANAGRARMLYQGANDGMLHAFVASTGAEAWAYVPNLVIGNLNNLSRKVGFTHKYYVDGTPAVADVDFGSGNWHTLLTGGLAKGGRGYYALDVTTPTAATEAGAVSKVLWEFPNSVANAGDRAAATLNMGYSFGKPLIVKSAAGWVVLVTSGYNNGTNAGDSGGDGIGHLYVLNPQTGDLIRDIQTTGCTGTPATNPCGLAQITASIAGDTVDYVYGGDLKGNIWRFDLTAATAASWSAAKFTTLVDGGGVAQPVTTAPAVSMVSGMRIVQVGTGQYLGNSDVATTQTQTIYGLWDQLVALTPLRSNLQQQTFVTAAGARTSSNTNVDYAVKKGWYVDLPDTGERANTAPAIDDLGNLLFTTNIPSPTPCIPGGTSWFYALNSKTGGQANRATNAWSGISLGVGLASRVTPVRLGNGDRVVLIRLSAGGAGGGPRTVSQKYASLPSIPLKRTSWRQVFQ